MQIKWSIMYKNPKIVNYAKKIYLHVLAIPSNYTVEGTFGCPFGAFLWRLLMAPVVYVWCLLAPFYAPPLPFSRGTLEGLTSVFTALYACMHMQHHNLQLHVRCNCAYPTPPKNAF